MRGIWCCKEDHPVGELTTLDKLAVDWSKTTVWGDGGYYARIFFNVAGREPQGVIAAADYESFRDRFIEHVQSIPAPDGAALDTRAFRPQDVYDKVKNVAPDLLVYLGNLTWRSVGSLGHGDIYTFENDTGPDDANHAENGVWVYSPPRSEKGLGGKQLEAVQLMDFAPTVLSLLDVAVPADMQGTEIELGG